MTTYAETSELARMLNMTIAESGTITITTSLIIAGSLTVSQILGYSPGERHIPFVALSEEQGF